MASRSSEIYTRPLKPKQSLLPDPAGLFGLATFWSLFLLAGKKSLLCADTFWHIKTGQIILGTGQILTHDIFSHTASGKQWIAHEWLAETFMAYCYNLGGLPGLSVVFFLFVSLTILLLFKVSQKASNEWGAFLAIAIAAAFAQTHLLIRPHVFTWLLGAVFLTLLMYQSRWLWLLPPLTALWGNLHGGVLLGLVLQAAFLSGNFLDSLSNQPITYWNYHWKKISRPFWVFLSSVILLGCNPFGYSLLLFPFHVSAEIFSQNITEWKAPDMQEMWHVRIWIILLGILATSYIRKTKWGWRFLLIFLVYQALGHVRHVSIAALFLAPWTAMAIKENLDKISSAQKGDKTALSLSSRSGIVLLSVSFVLLFSISVMQPGWWGKLTQERFSISEHYSKGAITFLQENGYPGKYLLNEYSWGGYLIFSLQHPPKVFIDGRADMYGEQIFSDYGKLTQVQPETEHLLEKYNIDWILYPKDSLLIRYLKTKPEWKELYHDNFVSILTLKSNG